MKIAIDPEFSKLLPERDFSELEEQILADGRIIDPLVVWKCDKQHILLDGHRRSRILDKHPSLPKPPPVVMEFESRDEAHDWVIHNQRARRNITEEEDRYLLGKLYLTRKPEKHRPKKPDTVSDLSPAAEIGAQEGKSERTVRRAAKFAEAVDAASELKDGILSGEVKGSAKDLKAFSSLTDKQKEKAKAAVDNGKTVKEAVAKAKPKPKAGKPVFDYKKWDKKLGELIRLTDDHHKAYPDKKLLDVCLESLGTYQADFEAWRRKVKA